MYNIKIASEHTEHCRFMQRRELSALSRFFVCCGIFDRQRKGEFGLEHKFKLALRLLLLLSVMSAIFVFSSQPADESQKLSDGFLDRLGAFLGFLPEIAGNAGKYIRKCAHFVEFMCMGMASEMFFSELYIDRRKRLLRSGAVSAAVCVMYACSDEFHQLFVPGRSCQAADVLIDSAGAALGIALVLACYVLKIRKAGHSDNG